MSQRNIFQIKLEALQTELTNIDSYTEAHRHGVHQPQNPTRQQVEAAKLNIQTLEQIHLQIEATKKKLEEEKRNNDEKLNATLAAIEQYDLLLQHLLSQQFEEECIELYHLDLIGNESFQEKTKILTRLNMHLDLVKPIYQDLSLLLQAQEANKTVEIEQHQENLKQHAGFAYRKVENENEKVLGARSKSTACLWSGGILATVLALGGVEAIVLGILVGVGVLTWGVAMPWIVVGAIAAIILVGGGLGEGFRFFDVKVPTQEYNHDAFAVAKGPLVNLLKLFQPKQEGPKASRRMDEQEPLITATGDQLSVQARA